MSPTVGAQYSSLSAVFATLVVVAAPEGFSWTQRKNGDVVIAHHGREATVLRGTRAQRFLADVQRGDDQQVMARATGNYRRGNERTAARHPRNQRRR